MITKLNNYKENILVPRNLENRKEKLRQETIKMLQQETIEGDLDITKAMLDIPANLVKVKIINGDLNCSSLGLTELPEWFKNIELITGDFVCTHNYELATLENCPQKIEGFMDCSANQLTTLQGCTQNVGKDFYCEKNQLQNLKGCPKIIHGNFYCYRNPITTLEDGPSLVIGTYKVLISGLKGTLNCEIRGDYY